MNYWTYPRSRGHRPQYDGDDEYFDVNKLARLHFATKEMNGGDKGFQLLYNRLWVADDGGRVNTNRRRNVQLK